MDPRDEAIWKTERVLPGASLNTGSSYAFLGIFDTTRHLFGVAPPASIALFVQTVSAAMNSPAYSTADNLSCRRNRSYAYRTAGRRALGVIAGYYATDRQS